MAGSQAHTPSQGRVTVLDIGLLGCSVSVDEAEHNAFVFALLPVTPGSNSRNPALCIVDLIGCRMVGSIPMPVDVGMYQRREFSSGIAVDAGIGRAFVASYSSDQLIVVDLRQRAVAGSLQLAGTDAVV